MGWYVNFFRALDPKLFDLIQPYAVKDDGLMPEEYRFSNPKGRPYHDDWFFGKKVRRMDCAYRVPLPFKVISGPHHKSWMVFDPAYPMSPGAETKMLEVWTGREHKTCLHVLTDRGDHGLVKYAAFINGEWRHVFTKYTGLWFGKRLSWYWGLHQDNTVSFHDDGSLRSDLMTWFPEVACSWVKEI